MKMSLHGESLSVCRRCEPDQTDGSWGFGNMSRPLKLSRWMGISAMRELPVIGEAEV